MVEGTHRLHTDRTLALDALRKYGRNDDPRVLTTTFQTYAPTYEKDLRLSRESLRAALEQLAASNPRAASVSLDQVIESRFVDEIRASGLVECLYAP
jgi:hypothetical protein